MARMARLAAGGVAGGSSQRLGFLGGAIGGGRLTGVVAILGEASFEMLHAGGKRCNSGLLLVEATQQGLDQGQDGLGTSVVNGSDLSRRHRRQTECGEG
jgi:hypothetical protein